MSVNDPPEFRGLRIAHLRAVSLANRYRDRVVLNLLEGNKEMSANETQVGGNHYKTGGEEHWDRVARLGLNYYEGNVTKYVERARKKNGIEDLKKAAHYLQKLIELAEIGLVVGYTPTQPQSKAELIEQTDKVSTEPCCECEEPHPRENLVSSIYKV